MRFQIKKWTPPNGNMQIETVEAPSRDALMLAHSMMGEKIEIMAEEGISKPVPQFENGNNTANALATVTPSPLVTDPGIEHEPIGGGVDQQKIAPFRPPPRPETLIPVPVMPPMKPILFEDGGVKFKIEAGVVSKKVWRDLTEEEQSDFRITPRVGDNECNGKIQRLDWIKIEGGR